MKSPPAFLVVPVLLWAFPALAGERSERLSPPDAMAIPSASSVANATGAPDIAFPLDAARDYILAAGYSSVTDLKPVNEFVWRGTAFKDGATFNVAVDYTGSVVGAN